MEAVAYCPDAPAFEPWLTASEVLAVAVGLLGIPRTRDALRDTLERVGLADVSHRRVAEFSRGMRSRLGLAAGLIREPQLLIADEPAAVLDPAGRLEIIDVLAALGGSVTVVASSHDLTDVERVCAIAFLLGLALLANLGAPASWLPTRLAAGVGDLVQARRYLARSRRRRCRDSSCARCRRAPSRETRN